MTEPDGSWNVVFRPRMMSRIAIGVAAVIAVAGIIVAVLNNRSSGAILRTADQVAMGGLALLLAGAVLLLLRPRLKAGPNGLAVRTLLDYRVIPWSEVVDFSFPPGRRWARIDLPANEYVPVVAIQSIDGEHAVTAMDTVRALMARYRPD
ncbi:MAG: PH domain-containing protein [Actinobacteria bacterium]|nr:PH domain-containing protein [Actinomycetota bacterium]